MRGSLRVLAILHRELGRLDLWRGRAVVLAYAVLTGLSIVWFARTTEWALAQFFSLRQAVWWSPLVWTPLSAAAIVWVTRRWVPGAAGSGIPQVMAALDPQVERGQRGLYVSLKLALGKYLLASWGLLAGLSLGREGPSVQVGAGIMHSARHWLPPRSLVSEHGLLVAGGAAGIAAAFNTPLAGVMFAIEELSRRPEQRNSGLIISAIVLAGLMGVSLQGNESYFGIIRVDDFRVDLWWPALLLALACGLAGGLFSHLMIRSLSGQDNDRFSRWRRARPVAFAGACGLLVALIGVSNQGITFGSGYSHSQAMLAGEAGIPAVYVLFMFLTTWLTAWSGVPGGIFAPSLAIGGALGNDIALLTGNPQAPALIALGMTGFLAAATQAPLTAFIIVMEMVNGHAMVLSLMACALVASGVSRILSRPLYGALAQVQLLRLPAKQMPQGPRKEAPAGEPEGDKKMEPTRGPGNSHS
ncbi:chloride channel protein [Ideonella dechloratans]|uniref:Chloride channel protein n=1 Tax=Ideonella dechloratans TaxID=36863 RepID=A0A643FBL1_IDEDE|nr:chloride channel protein [Ideonella dechloratans]KAB0581600.1 chloride channel protein [Ideonella dechloratans]UFU11382.1 chloride channel protein [Ideonella dechloratans]